jgi:hypothetical protein
LTLEETESKREEGFETGDLVVESCNDGLVHAFKWLDDGQMEAPACGSSARPTGREVELTEVVCEPCIHLMASALECDVDLVKAVVGSLKEEKKART